MELKGFQKIMKTKYMPIEALAYYVEVGKKITKDMRKDEIILTLDKLLLKEEKEEMLGKLNPKSAFIINNYWSLSIEQVINYGYILFEILQYKKDYTEEEIAKLFACLMQLYSPDNVDEIMDRRCKH